MGLRISGKNLDIGNALREHINEKISAAAARYFDGAVQGHVVVEREGAGFRSDCALHLSSGATIAADGRGMEPYVAFDTAAERIEKRLRRYKSRLKDHHVNGSEPAPAPELLAEQVIETPHEDEENDAFVPTIISESHTRIKVLTVANAVMELDVTGANVTLFRHAGTGHVNLVYRRRDGHIGWIDPTSITGKAGPDSRLPVDKAHKSI